MIVNVLLTLLIVELLLVLVILQMVIQDLEIHASVIILLVGMKMEVLVLDHALLKVDNIMKNVGRMKEMLMQDVLKIHQILKGDVIVQKQMVTNQMDQEIVIVFKKMETTGLMEQQEYVNV